MRKGISVIYCPDKHVIFIEDLIYDTQRVVSRKNIGICYLQVFSINCIPTNHNKAEIYASNMNSFNQY